MRNLKKFLALVMAMVMAFSLMLTVNAANPVKTFDDAGSITEEFVEAADVLTGMKVFQGDEGGFRPADTITRAEVAALIYRLATGDTGDTRKDLYKDYGNFADVNSTDWFAGYVGYCANAGYIKGHGGYFNPYDSVTGYEALAMILRAVGYDKNHEFEGATWQTNVSALGTQLGILKQVKSTDYGDRLYEPSRRDVVASLLFETAAYVPMVEYTPMAGYNKFENIVSGVENDTLGEKNFGLTSRTGIIVGNQETGEKWTKVGFELTTGNLFTGEPSYTYATTDDQNITLSFNTDTGLDMFGHKFKVWYDYTSNVTTQTVPSTTDKFRDEFKTVYATFDKAVLASYVYATNGDISDGSGSTTLRTAAKGAGFANTSETRWSDRYSIIRGDALRDDVDDYATVDGGSPVNMYYLVSNNDDKTVDVAVRLSHELARICKVDTTSTTKTLTLGTGNSDFGYDSSNAAADGEIRLSKLTKDSVQTLGEIVYATEIVGTDGLFADRTVVANAGDWMYKLEKPETQEGAITAAEYDGDDGSNVTKIILADGSTLDRSGIVEDGTGTSDSVAIDASACDVIDGCVTILQRGSMRFGVNLTIYKDKLGRVMGVKEGTDRSFLYGTFADYEIGGLGTGTIKYAITGIDWDGNKVVNHDLISITNADRDTTYRDGTADTLADGYSELTNYPNTTGILDITKKYLGSDNNNVTGNQIVDGVYRGYIIDPAGNLWNHETNVTVPLALDGKTYAKRVQNDRTWTVSASDAANGFANVANADGAKLLTSETKFIVVDGTGTATLDAKVYNGLTEFLDGSSQVTLAIPADGSVDVYYRTEADLYSNTNTNGGNNDKIVTVIMPKSALTYANRNNLYFALDNGRTGVTHGGYDQYVLYNNGEKGYYFLDGAPNTRSFHYLVPSTTVDGQTIYTAQRITAGAMGDDVRTAAPAGFCYTNSYAGARYTYLTTSDLSTAQIGTATYRVDNAKVVDLATTGVDTDGNGANTAHNKFENVRNLNNAIALDPTNVTVNVAIINDGVNVSTIYVVGYHKT